MDTEIGKALINLGACGVLGFVFYLVFKGIQLQVNRILEAHGEERKSWHESASEMHKATNKVIIDNTCALEAVEKTVSNFSDVLEGVDCISRKPAPRHFKN